MSDTLAALASAGIVCDTSDFADPHIDGPTALTVTADGRVYGHLTAWGTRTSEWMHAPRHQRRGRATSTSTRVSS